MEHADRTEKEAGRIKRFFKKLSILDYLLGAFSLIGFGFLIFGLVHCIKGYDHRREVKTWDKVPGEVVELNVRDGEIQVTVSFTYRGTERRVTWDRDNLYQGDKITLLVKEGREEEAAQYYDSVWGDPAYNWIYYMLVGVFVIALCFGIILFFRLSRFIHKKRSVGEMMWDAVTVIFRLSIIFLAATALFAVLQCVETDKEKARQANYKGADAVLLSVAEPHEVEETYLDNNGNRQTRTKTEYRGVTVAQYEVDGTEFKAKYADSEDNYVGKHVRVYYEKDRPGKLMYAPGLSFGYKILFWIFGFMGIIFLITSLIARRFLFEKDHSLQKDVKVKRKKGWF